MRPGRTQIGMSYSYRPPLRLHEIGLTSSQLLDRDKKLSYRSEFFSSYLTTNFRPGPEISSLYAFGAAICLLDEKMSTRHQAFRPGFYV